MVKYHTKILIPSAWICGVCQGKNFSTIATCFLTSPPDLADLFFRPLWPYPSTPPSNLGWSHWHYHMCMHEYCIVQRRYLCATKSWAQPVLDFAVFPRWSAPSLTGRNRPSKPGSSQVHFRRGAKEQQCGHPLTMFYKKVEGLKIGLIGVYGNVGWGEAVCYPTLYLVHNQKESLLLIIYLRLWNTYWYI